MIFGKKNNYRSILLLHIFLSCFLIIAFITIHGQSIGQSDDVNVFIDGPDSIQLNSTVQYTIKITGGPAEEGGIWRYDAKIENERGIDIRSDLIKVEPNNGTSTENIFKVNVTVVSSIRMIRLVVNGGSSSNLTGNISWSGDVFQEIEVFEPINVKIKATVRNSGLVDAENVKVSFYVFHKDGTSTFIGDRMVNVSANSTTEVSIEWVASKKDRGEHEVEVRINEEESLIELDNGDNVMRMTIYVGEPPEREMRPIMIFNSPGLVFIIGFFGFLFLISGFFMWRNTLRGRGYYSERATYAMYFEGILMVTFSLPLFYVSQILSANPDVEGDPVTKLAEGVVIFIFGFITLLFNWDRTRKKRR